MQNERAIFTVSQLNRQVKNFLENSIPKVSVEGEISNFTKPASGHYYFSLKDNQAQIRSVFFKTHHNTSLIKLQDGQHIIAHGKLSLYEARGDYQLIIESVEEAGLGALFLQFEALKKKLELQGYFAESHKKSLPAFPSSIGIITSPTGAAVKDILTTLNRRYRLPLLTIYPSEVQGARAASQLVQAIKQANQDKKCDVLILARGGGSIEDLWPFNDEQLAKAIYDSEIPIVSGVGHETDFTIADFVADKRAATPTAAAELCTPSETALLALINQHQNRLQLAMSQLHRHYQLKLQRLIAELLQVRYQLLQQSQRIDGLTQALFQMMRQVIHQKQLKTLQLSQTLERLHPKIRILSARSNLDNNTQLMTRYMTLHLNNAKARFTEAVSKLDTLSPLSTLNRGYAIAMKNNRVITEAKAVRVNDEITVKLFKGELNCNINKIGE